MGSLYLFEGGGQQITEVCYASCGNVFNADDVKAIIIMCGERLTVHSFTCTEGLGGDEEGNPLKKVKFV